MHYHGSNQGNGGVVESDAIASHGREHSLSLTCPRWRRSGWSGKRDDLTRGRKPAPLGASYDGKVEFRLLCPCGAGGAVHRRAGQRATLRSPGAQRRHLARLAAAGPGLRYGYGYMVPDPAQGHRFNPAKLLIDPSAHRVEGDCLTMSAARRHVAARLPRQRRGRAEIAGGRSAL